jgi:hypothetical protein
MILSERLFSSGKDLFFISPRESISPALPDSLREPGKFPISSKEERERELPDGSLARAISFGDSAHVRQVAADLQSWFTNHRPLDHQTCETPRHEFSQGISNPKPNQPRNSPGLARKFFFPPPQSQNRTRPLSTASTPISDPSKIS